MAPAIKSAKTLTQGFNEVFFILVRVGNLGKSRKSTLKWHWPIKLIQLPCLVCSIWQMFFYWSPMVPIMVHLPSRNLFQNGSSWFSMFRFTLFSQPIENQIASVRYSPYLQKVLQRSLWPSLVLGFLSSTSTAVSPPVIGLHHWRSDGVNRRTNQRSSSPI